MDAEKVPTMKGLTSGRIVHYVTSEQDEEQVNRRRTDPHTIIQRMENGSWHEGAQAHIGNPASYMDHLPMVITRVWDYYSGVINGQVFLDGNDTLWVTSVPYSEGKLPRTWHWIEQA